MGLVVLRVHDAAEVAGQGVVECDPFFSPQHSEPSPVCTSSGQMHLEITVRSQRQR